ncbi:MAG: glycosyltransferase family 2 protein [Candidatus Baldrarchaeia archaeon]
MTRKASVSVIILTLNEEENIEECLKSVHCWSDDIYVVDSFSRDSTVDIAKRFTQNVYKTPMAHWAHIRNWALKNLPLKYEWVLFLDADERLTEEIKEEINTILKGSPKENGFYIKRRFFFLGRWLKHGGLYTNVLRLFKRNCTYYVEFGDSEYAVVKGKVGFLRNDMIHEDKKGISRWIEKHVKIAEREAKKIIEKKKIELEPDRNDVEIEGKKRIRIRAKIWDRIPLLLRPFLLFIYCYFIKLGFLDGKEGLIYHLFWALWYRLLVYVKVRELTLSSRENDL